jgi:hypothetical protein
MQSTAALALASIRNASKACLAPPRRVRSLLAYARSEWYNPSATTSHPLDEEQAVTTDTFAQTWYML